MLVVVVIVVVVAEAGTGGARGAGGTERGREEGRGAMQVLQNDRGTVRRFIWCREGEGRRQISLWLRVSWHVGFDLGMVCRMNELRFSFFDLYARKKEAKGIQRKCIAVFWET